jgi:hypothetical protein
MMYGLETTGSAAFAVSAGLSFCPLGSVMACLLEKIAWNQVNGGFAGPDIVL